ncbi:MAG: tripartite tricarboxylate transporter TctB family protein [Negativicutes bacterium]
MNLLSGIVPLVIGFVMIYNSYELGLGRLTRPGAGLWPFILSAIMIVASIVVLIQNFRCDDREKFSSEAKNVLYGILSIIGYIFLFDTIGLVISSFFLLIIWIRFLGKEPWKLAFLVSTAVTSSLYLLFVAWLNIPLPESLL